MNYLLKNHCLTILTEKNDRRIKFDSSNIFVKKIDESHWLIINSFLNVVIVTDDFSDGSLNICCKKYLYTPNSNLKKCIDYYNKVKTNIAEKYGKYVTFILTITYKCNLHCVYCYQQNCNELKKELISSDNLKYVFGIIESYIHENPEKNISISLFGGEPLLKENEAVIDNILRFCLKNHIGLSITTNGVELKYFAKKLIIYRGLLSSIEVTVDSIYNNENTRTSIIDNFYKSKFENLISSIKLLVNNKVFVSVGTNIDKKNLNQMKDMYDYFAFELLKSKFFEWVIGRVDDRLFETNYPNIIDEVDIIEMFLALKIKESNVHLAVFKATYPIGQKLNILGGQGERKGLLNYCWAQSSSDYVFYIDNELNVFRCPYTVGRANYKIGKFTKMFLDSYKVTDTSYLNDQRCKNCRIGGYCSGGCYLSTKADSKRFCEEERRTFEKFIDNIVIPVIYNLLRKT